MTTDTDTEQLRDAEDALTAFYARVLQVERELTVMTQRAEVAERDLVAARDDLDARQQELDARTLELTQEREAHAQRLTELDQQLANAHTEIDALHNSRTMRYAAAPRRIYAKLRNP